MGPGGGGSPAAADEPRGLLLESLPGRRGREPGTIGADPAVRGAAAARVTGRVDPRSPRVLERHDVAPGLIRLRVERPSGFDFRAGQSVKFGFPGNQRSYTLASAPTDPALEFFIELVPGGRLSEALRSVRAGSHMALAPRAKGSFLLDEKATHHLFVATVTGITPFVSILREQLGPVPGRHRFVVLHGASHADELGYADELSALAARHPDRLTYVPTVSRPLTARNAGWSGATGRVDTLVRTALESHGLLSKTTAVYACGNSGMIRNVSGTAKTLGLRFHAEAFD